MISVIKNERIVHLTLLDFTLFGRKYIVNSFSMHISSDLRVNLDAGLNASELIYF